MPLDKQQKENWLKALRSGEYKQGKGTLRTVDNKYCCIGVFAVCNNISLTEDGFNMLINDLNIGYAPLRDQIGQFEINALTTMNDEKDKSFLEIANYIEQNL